MSQSSILKKISLFLDQELKSPRGMSLGKISTFKRVKALIDTGAAACHGFSMTYGLMYSMGLGKWWEKVLTVLDECSLPMDFKSSSLNPDINENLAALFNRALYYIAIGQASTQWQSAWLAREAFEPSFSVSLRSTKAGRINMPYFCLFPRRFLNQQEKSSLFLIFLSRKMKNLRNISPSLSPNIIASAASLARQDSKLCLKAVNPI
ncbi:MAG: hypothetical protein QM752_03250 [Gammaproteobacteria bacterium]